MAIMPNIKNGIKPAECSPHLFWKFHYDFSLFFRYPIGFFWFLLSTEFFICQGGVLKKE